MIAVLYEIIRNDQVLHLKVLIRSSFAKCITRGLVNAPGSPSDLYSDKKCFTETNVLCSIIRMISGVYLNTGKFAFPPKTTAGTLLSQIYPGNILANHKRLLEVIRDKILPRVTPESQLPPSVTALQRYAWRAIMYLRQISNPHATPLEAEGTVL